MAGQHAAKVFPLEFPDLLVAMECPPANNMESAVDNTSPRVGVVALCTAMASSTSDRLIFKPLFGDNLP